VKTPTGATKFTPLQDIRIIGVKRLSRKELISNIPVGEDNQGDDIPIGEDTNRGDDIYPLQAIRITGLSI
jgi:hypothetical protein